LKLKIHGNIKIDRSDFCKPCEKNLKILNAEIIYGDQSAFVKCSQGFKLDGNPFLFCLRTSKWDLSRLPSCKIVKCSPVKTPANGRLQISKISYKGIARFSCDDGFELIGSDSISCTENGTWSGDIPRCKSIFECPAFEPIANGRLIYANDNGIIHDNLTSYSLGTFVEIKCNDGFSTEQENLISCTDNGEWDFDVEDCKADAVDVQLTTEFLKQMKELIFESCIDNKPDLCKFYKIKDFETSIASFELPDSSDYDGMDTKLYELLKKIQNQNELNPQNFLRSLLRNNIMQDKTRLESYRFIISLYIDLMIFDRELNITLSDEMDDNINDNIKRLLKKAIEVVYANHVKNL
jgi:Sushi repeat (SCR repeat)